MNPATYANNGPEEEWWGAADSLNKCSVVTRLAKLTTQWDINFHYRDAMVVNKGIKTKAKPHRQKIKGMSFALKGTNTL